MDTRFHVRELAPEEWELVDGLPVTSVVTTVHDLAQAGIDGGHLAGVVRDALVDAHADLSALARALRPYAHRYGSRLGDGEAFIEDLLDLAGVPTSTLDTAAAVSSRQAREADRLLSSPAMVENLRYLQSPALHQALAQLDELSGRAAAASALTPAQIDAALAALQVQQAIPSEMIANTLREQLSAMGTQAHADAIQALSSPAIEAAQRALAAPGIEAAERALRTSLAEVAQISTGPSGTAYRRQESIEADAHSASVDKSISG